MANEFTIRNTVNEQIANVGRAAVSNLFPRDVEYYMCALELTTAEGDTIDYFAFPIMPKNIQKSEHHKTSYYHGLNSTIILNTDTFTPGEITLSGDFGRSFKVLFDGLGKDIVKFRGVRFSRENGVYTHDDVNGKFNFKVPELAFSIKSGYGCIKVLQSIISKAKGQVDGKSFRLYFYNPALGESYLVVPTKNPLTIQQDESRNMIWGYTLNLTVLAPMEKVVTWDKRVTSLAKGTSIDLIQKGVNNLLGDLAKYVR